MPTKKTLARVCREAGAVVLTSVKLRDMNISISATDDRAIEVLAMGLPLHQGAQLAIDITLRSALTTTGEPCPGGATMNGAALPGCSTTEGSQIQGTVGRSSLRFDCCGRRDGRPFWARRPLISWTHWQLRKREIHSALTVGCQTWLICFTGSEQAS